MTYQLHALLFSLIVGLPAVSTDLDPQRDVILPRYIRPDDRRGIADRSIPLH